MTVELGENFLSFGKEGWRYILVVGGMWWDILCDIFHGWVGLVGGMSWVDIFNRWVGVRIFWVNGSERTFSMDELGGR